MHITEVEVTNYKSFHKSSKITLGPGINVMVGENNTGKTSLVEALGLKFTNQPHRSRETFRPPFIKPDPLSLVQLTVSLSEAEFRDALRAISPFFVFPTTSNAEPSLLISAVHERNSVICKFKGASQLGQPTHIVDGYLVGFGAEPLQKGQAVEFTYDGNSLNRVQQRAYSDDQEYGFKIAALIRDSIYAFKAERYNLGACAAGNNKVLASDASNLAEVLDVLQAHPAKWNQFNSYVRHIFPQIHAISVNTRRSTRASIHHRYTFTYCNHCGSS